MLCKEDPSALIEGMRSILLWIALGLGGCTQDKQDGVAADADAIENAVNAAQAEADDAKGD